MLVSLTHNHLTSNVLVLHTACGMSVESAVGVKLASSNGNSRSFPIKCLTDY